MSDSGRFVDSNTTVDVNSHSEDRSRMEVSEPDSIASFVIQYQPANRDSQDCYNTGLADLKPVKCYGEIELRRPNGDD